MTKFTVPANQGLFMTRKTPTQKLGFTLMELLIAIAIIAILAVIAVPTYLHYTKKAYYSEVVQTAERYKAAVTTCVMSTHGKLRNCDAGKHDIPLNITEGVGQVNSVTVTNGIITVTPNPINKIKATDTYILTPSYTPEGVKWSASGGGCQSSLAPNC